MKHMIEAQFVEELLSAIGDRPARERQQAQLMRFDRGFTGLWPFYSCVKMQPALEKAGLIRSVRCGDARLMLIEARPSYDAMLNLLRFSPEKWLDGEILQWIDECRRLAGGEGL